MKFASSALLVGLVLSFGCSKDELVSEQPLVSVDNTIEGDVVVGNESKLLVRNAIGPVIVSSSGDSNRVHWFMNRVVTGRSNDVTEARAQLGLIELMSNSNGDTLTFASHYPLDMSRFRYTTLVSLSIPYRMRCIVDGVQGTTYISHLGADLVVRNAHSVIVIGQNASCDIASMDGGDTVEVAIPDSGFCTVQATTGDIILNIPALTSANVTARAINGSVSYSNLTFSGLSQLSDSLSGVLGGGSGRILLRTGGGNIIIRGL